MRTLQLKEIGALLIEMDVEQTLLVRLLTSEGLQKVFFFHADVQTHLDWECLIQSSRPTNRQGHQRWPAAGGCSATIKKKTQSHGGPVGGFAWGR